jgi:cytochrome c oxidase cbb3-type subunit 1
MYIVRAIGGALYLIGALIMAYNLVRTALGHGQARDAEAVPAPASAQSPALQPAE